MKSTAPPLLTLMVLALEIPVPLDALDAKLSAAYVPLESRVPLVAVVRFIVTTALLAFHKPVIVSVAPPLVVKNVVPLPIGFPLKLIAPPPLVPVKLKWVFAQLLFPDAFNVKTDVLLIFSEDGPVNVDVAPRLT